MTGIDLTEDFCRVARTLTKLVELSSKVRFRNGNALAMPFQDRSFDVVLLQHATMNIADKKQLYRSQRRRDCFTMSYESPRNWSRICPRQRGAYQTH